MADRSARNAAVSPIARALAAAIREVADRKAAERLERRRTIRIVERSSDGGGQAA